MCGLMTYDGHKGTDFALRSIEAMRQGVDVVAAAPGRVVAMRNSVLDRLYTEQFAHEVTGKECGNGAVIEHEGNWTTQYCHLKRGTLKVAIGDDVQSGDVLGQVGLSGKTGFPHIHFLLRQGDDVIDPFDGADVQAACSPTTAHNSLWKASSGIQATPGGVIAKGVTSAVPEYGEVWDHAPHWHSMKSDTPALVHWVLFFGVRMGDILEVTIYRPDQTTLITDRIPMTRNRNFQFQAIGRRKPAEGWPPGTFTASSKLIRDGKTLAVTQTKTTVRE